MQVVQFRKNNCIAHYVNNYDNSMLSYMYLQISHILSEQFPDCPEELIDNIAKELQRYIVDHMYVP